LALLFPSSLLAPRSGSTSLGLREDARQIVPSSVTAPMTRRLITLTTDFGQEDPFVGVMKGVISGIAPEVLTVDITHGIPSHDILRAALVLRSSYRFFPEGTVHVVVVDPGVGSHRRPILIVTPRFFFVGPDNGVLSLASELEDKAQVFHLISRKHFLEPVSNTFHGRDIFSPVAAWLTRGVSPDILGERVDNLVKIDFPRVRKKGNTLIARVLYSDKFGNLVTNISADDLPRPEKESSSFVIQIAGREICRLCSSYAEAAPGEIFSIWGSSGLLEISINQASAAEALRIHGNQEFGVVLPATS
jgi:S-adenosyl-L-methionine hydrolase (adenosine-forming)